MSNATYRLVTRSDFDGLACAALLKELDLIDEIVFVHPKDVQDGKISISDRDITTNLPYSPQAHLVFDHHLSEIIRNEDIYTQTNHVFDAYAPSTARVVYNYFGGEERFQTRFQDMIVAVDKADSAQFTLEEVLQPQDWVLLNFLMDSRTGLGRFQQFRISNEALLRDLIDYCRQYSIPELLQIPDVQERIQLYFEHQDLFKAQLQRCATVHDKVVVLDLRAEETLYVGNRFMVYALFPDCHASIHILWGKGKQNTSLAVGKSIFNRSCKTYIGELMLQYGGGGHGSVGTCQVPHEQADQLVPVILEQLNRS